MSFKLKILASHCERPVRLSPGNHQGDSHPEEKWPKMGKREETEQKYKQSSDSVFGNK